LYRFLLTHYLQCHIYNNMNDAAYKNLHEKAHIELHAHLERNYRQITLTLWILIMNLLVLISTGLTYQLESRRLQKELSELQAAVFGGQSGSGHKQPPSASKQIHPALPLPGATGPVPAAATPTPPVRADEAFPGQSPEIPQSVPRSTPATPATVPAH